jgi:hypothetical protein
MHNTYIDFAGELCLTWLSVYYSAHLLVKIFEARLHDVSCDLFEVIGLDTALDDNGFGFEA